MRTFGMERCLLSAQTPALQPKKLTEESGDLRLGRIQAKDENLQPGPLSLTALQAPAIGGDPPTSCLKTLSFSSG